MDKLIKRQNIRYRIRKKIAGTPEKPRLSVFRSNSEIYAQLIEQAGSLLRGGGILVLELGFDSADRVRAMLAAERRWVNISITNDLAGIPRVLAAERA